MNNLTQAQIATIVERYIKDIDFNGEIIPLQVDTQHIQAGEGWWRVPIRMARMPKNSVAYYVVMAEVEEQIAEQENLNILLVTGAFLEEETKIQHVSV